MSRIYTNNINSEGGNSIDIETGLNVSGILSATSFTGDATGLTGIAVTSIRDSGNTVRVEATTSGAVVSGILTATTLSATTIGITTADVTTVSAGGSITAASFYGDGSGIVFDPKIIAYDPGALSTGVSVDTNITFTFDQNIYFSGAGTINIRETSVSGTIVESFAINGPVPPSGLSISGTQLIINPSSNLSGNTTYYITLPSQGIANLAGAYYAGSSNYNFQTVSIGSTFSATGGDYTFTRTSPTSPTGYYKYHIFNSSGPLVMNANATEAEDFAFMMVAGGGGGSGRGPSTPSNYGGAGGGGAGGYITRIGPTLGLPHGSYTVTIGGGGTPTGSPYYQGTPGTESKVENPNITLAVQGGGAGAVARSPSSPRIGSPGGSGGGGWAWADTTAPQTSSGGLGVPGQGYPGGIGKNKKAVNPYPHSGPSPAGPPYASFGGGGGGAGGAGGNADGYPHPTWNPDFGPNNKMLRYAGPGGTGESNTNFTISDFAGYVPIPVMPLNFLGAIGSTGLYAGGGGGGASPESPGESVGGYAGPGGGGWGYPQNMPGPYQPYYPPAYPGSPPSPYATPVNATINMGGGGGGSDTSTAGNGGSGIVLIRYAVTI